MISMFHTGGDAVKVEHMRTFSSEEGLSMSCLHGIKTYCAHSLGGFAPRLGPPERADLRLRRRVRRRRVRRDQKRRVLRERIRRAALAGAVLPVAGDGGEVRAEADAQRLLSLPPHPRHCSRSRRFASTELATHYHLPPL